MAKRLVKRENDIARKIGLTFEAIVMRVYNDRRKIATSVRRRAISNVLTKLEITRETSADISVVALFVIDGETEICSQGKRGGTLMSSSTQKLDSRRATYRELNGAWNPGIPRQSHIIRRVYDIPRPS